MTPSVHFDKKQRTELKMQLKEVIYSIIHCRKILDCLLHNNVCMLSLLAHEDNVTGVNFRAHVLS